MISVHYPDPKIEHIFNLKTAIAELHEQYSRGLKLHQQSLDLHVQILHQFEREVERERSSHQAELALHSQSLEQCRIDAEEVAKAHARRTEETLNQFEENTAQLRKFHQERIDGIHQAHREEIDHKTSEFQKERDVLMARHGLLEVQLANLENRRWVRLGRAVRLMRG